MKFCSECASPVEQRVPEGDNRLRYVCVACGHIHYQNPRLVVGTLPIWGDRILLCRRAIEPRHGFWTLPAGFMEEGETVSEGAMRETIEEAGARVEMGHLYSMIDVTHVGQVHVFYLARLLDLDFAPGPESLEVQLFEGDQIPWDEIAFPTVAQTLEHYLRDRPSGEFPLHTGAIKDRYGRKKSIIT